MKLQIQSRSGREVVHGGLEVQEQATVADVQRALHAKKPLYYPSRQRLTLTAQGADRKPTVLLPEKRLSDYSLRDGSVLLFKDLGPQIGYGMVFFWEYFGPLAVYAAIYFLPQLVYCWHKQPVEKTLVQKLAMGYWTFHYTKRIFETFLVHKFSHATMPIFNLFKNCSYYWGFGAFVAYYVNHPLFTEPPHAISLPLFGLAMLCQLSNFWCHIILANLRPAGQKAYVIPKGFLFDYITCPNYTTEVVGWICFSIATSTLPAMFFCLSGTAQMWQWAAGKHARLRKLFDGKEGRDKYPKRWVMLPPIF